MIVVSICYTGSIREEYAQNSPHINNKYLAESSFPLTNSFAPVFVKVRYTPLHTGTLAS